MQVQVQIVGQERQDGKCSPRISGQAVVPPALENDSSQTSYPKISVTEADRLRSLFSHRDC